MLHHERCYLTIEAVKEQHIALANLVEHGDEIAFSVSGTLGCFESTDIRDVAAIANGVVVDVVSYILYQTVVADSDIAQCSIVDARMLIEILRHFDAGLENAQRNLAIEHHTAQKRWLKVIVDLYVAPVLSPTAMVFKDRNLCI